MHYLFDEFTMDTRNFELTRNGDTVALEPQVFDLLLYFVKNPDRIISKSELLDKVWTGRVVSESTLTSCIKAARKALGDDGQNQRFISTITRRGYRFLGNITIEDTSQREAVGEMITQSNLAASQESNSACAFPVEPELLEEKIVILVLPFSGTGSELVQFFSETLYEDINIHLARTPGFMVVSRNTAAYYKNTRLDSQQIASELGAQYIIDGSVRGMGDNLNLSINLQEASSGKIIWAIRKEVPTKELETLQNEIILHIVSAIEPEINRTEFATLRKRRQVDLGAWELYRQGHAILGLKGWSEETFSECADLLRQAITKDPELAFAHAYLSLILAIGHLVGLVTQPDWQEEALAAAEKAIALDSQDSDVLGYAGCAFCDMGDFSRGIRMLERAVELDPSNAQGWAALGAAQLRTGKEEGIKHMYHGIRISPRDNRLGAWGAILSRGLLSFGKVDEAIEVAQKSCAFDDKIFLPRIVLSVAYAVSGNKQEAKKAIDDARRIRPGLNQEDIQRFVQPEEMQKMAEFGLLA